MACPPWLCFNFSFFVSFVFHFDLVFVPIIWRVSCFSCLHLFFLFFSVQVQEARTWQCFLCQPFTRSSHGLLKPHTNWREDLVLFFDMGFRTTVVSLKKKLFKEIRQVIIIIIIMIMNKFPIALFPIKNELNVLKY